jgi:hypothetical protein
MGVSASAGRFCIADCGGDVYWGIENEIKEGQIRSLGDILKYGK